MECRECDSVLVEVTTLQDEERQYLCPNCSKIFTDDYIGNKQDDTCKYCGNKLVEDLRGNCASCGAHK